MEKQQDLGEQKGFRGELFGFNRVEVLSYIERISAANAEKAKALGETIDKLQKELQASLEGRQTAEEKLADLQQEHETFLSRTKEVCAQLETEKMRAETAVKQADRLQQELKKASNDAAAFRQRLLSREKELDELKQQNTGLTEKITKLEESIHLYESKQKAALSEREQMAAEAKLVLEKAKIKADDVVKEAQAKAQMKLEQAEGQAALVLAKASEEKSLIKARMSESADSIAASVVVLKSQLEHVNKEIVSASNELLKATDGISAALGNTQRDLEKLGLQMQNYPQQTKVPAYAPPAQAEKQDSLEVSPVRIPQGVLPESFDEERYRASWEKIRNEEAQKDRYYDALAREEWNRTHKLSCMNNTQRDSSVPVVQVEDKMFQNVSQTAQYPYDRQQVVQQPIVGHLHRPTAMPFAPFDKDVQRTSSNEAQKESNVQQEWGEYVPTPTPVTPIASFSEPFLAAQEPATQSAPDLEEMPKLRKTVSRNVQKNDPIMQEPVIIPYDAPIPEMVDPGVKHKPEPEPSAKESSPGETTLSDALLENLNKLLNGNK
ncbi:hypothetical protein [uncultured Ruthenibacterium sp.]|uniref:hypothetical protein n=1 Tax=uncultured Ruthenibacterium sp. TaxID=1905347 RepID=UPI00349F024C